MLLKSVTSMCVGSANYEMPLVQHRCAMKKAARCTLLNFFEGGGLGVKFTIYYNLHSALCSLKGERG